ncbi:response regulator transcription factor [Spirosoma endophyticum]|uniref:Helix-turn-helix domain-containing protein n=1 Tax=Spirosoma endophyticum TaxID=662367 RepID=A0A1I2EYL2_9BACT|nr:response regulator [Spirosoma endophyticum]SFE97330.1 Helix-turn-helix domain-containing protein [Spirosoma endophyticum]
MPNVLLIEDYPVLRDNLKEQLELAHYQVRAVEHGAQALALLPLFRPDLIICDILMPEMDGLAFLRALQQNTLYRSIPLIFLTAKESPAERLEGLSLGAVDYVCKPFSSAELLLKITNLIHQQTELIRYQLQRKIAQETPDIQFIRQVSEHLEHAYSQASFGLDQLAEAMHRSPSALQRQLKHYCQRSFSQVLKDYRLLKAASYLVDTDRPLQVVAVRCGFSSLSAFSHCFKEAYGLSPLRYRQANWLPTTGSTKA